MRYLHCNFGQVLTPTVTERAKLRPGAQAQQFCETEMTTLSSLRVLALTVIPASMLACSAAPPAGAPGNDRLQPAYDQSGKLEKLEYDRNADGKVDTWGFMDGTRVVRVEADENGDGKVDSWEFHKAASAGPAGATTSPETSVERIEKATKFDGRVSRWSTSRTDS